MNMLIRRTILHILAAVLCLGCLEGCVVGKYMCKYALRPEDHGTNIEATRRAMDRDYPGIVKWHDDLKAQRVFRDTVITGEGGKKLHAVYASASDPSTAGGTAIVIHGYTCNHFTFMNLIRMYRDSLNFNVLAPDLHFHGLSEGEAIQMGWKDRLDILRWIDVAHGIFDDDFMAIHGVSMGGATTMMTSGEQTPSFVRAFVDDCGYSSVWDQFKHNLKQQFHLPAFPVLTSASIVCKKRYGWTFREASSVDQLAKSSKPVLFIHGDSDDFVPTAHAQVNFDAKVRGYKELWLAPGSGHGLAFKDHPEEYTARVKAFLDKVRRENL